MSRPCPRNLARPMPQHAARRLSIAPAIRLFAVAVALTGAAWPLAAQKAAPRQAAAEPAAPKAEKAAPSTKSEQAIFLLDLVAGYRLRDPAVGYVSLAQLRR